MNVMRKPDGNVVELKCSKCSATLPVKDGQYGACPLCGWVADERYIRRESYFQIVEQRGVVVSHEFSPEEFVYIHPISENIPCNSAIIVEEYQKAAYRAAGQYDWLEPDLYPFKGDSRSQEEILKAIALGEVGQALNYVGTRVIFFDMHKKFAQGPLQLEIPASQWLFRTKVQFEMQITDPEKLMERALNMHDDEAVGSFVRLVVYQTIDDQLAAAISDMDGLDLRPGANGTILRRTILDKLTDALRQQMAAAVNDKLVHRGILIQNIRFSEPDTECIDQANMEKVNCAYAPYSGCTGSTWIPKGSHASWKCPVCGLRVAWCDHCGRFQSTWKRPKTCDACERVI